MRDAGDAAWLRTLTQPIFRAFLGFGFLLFVFFSFFSSEKLVFSWEISPWGGKSFPPHLLI